MRSRDKKEPEGPDKVSVNKTREEPRTEERWSMPALEAESGGAPARPLWRAHSAQLLVTCNLCQLADLVILTREQGHLLFLKSASWGRQGTRDIPI